MPANTIRAWVIGMLLCTIGSGVNMLFSLRNPSISITTYVIQLIAYPLGLGWDLIMPDRVWNVWGVKFNLRPGKFNFKEHVVITAMSNVSFHRRWISSIVFANCVYIGCVRWRRFILDRRSYRSATLLWSILWMGFPNPFRYYDTLHRIWSRWSSKEIPCLAGGHDMAC